MSDALTKYSFLSWLREGVGTAIGPVHPPSADVPRRAAVDVAFDVNSDPAAHVHVGLHLYGPGDVVGIDLRLVVRTIPPHQSTDFEPNYFPAIEFATPGLPWLFTPLPAASERLFPWICLVVVRKQDGVAFETADAKRPLAVLRIEAPAEPLHELPDLSESWAWAHGHVSWSSRGTTDGDVDREELARLLRESPNQTVSRLVCPRRLQPGEQYYACVVPVFDAGVKAGLGELTPGDDGPDTLDFAWNSHSPPGTLPVLPFRLPVYYHWEFTAGAAGDFESLVRRITARRALPGVGQRSMDVSHPGPFQLEMPGVVLGLEGALQRPGMDPTPWPNETLHLKFETGLAEMLDAPATAAPPPAPQPGTPPPITPVPVVAPPLYGQVPAERDTVPADGQPPVWLRDLNLDPRNRAAAAFGTAVVQEQQEQLMASAWAQLGELRKLNQVLRQAQLARAVTAVAHDKCLRTLRPASLIAISRPVLTRIGTPDPSIRDVSALRARMRDTGVALQTFHRVIADSTITAGALSSAFQQIARPGGPIARRLFAPDEPVRANVVERLNAKQIVAASPRTAPDGTVSLDAVTARLKPKYGERYKDVCYEAATPDKFTDDMPGWADEWKYHAAAKPATRTIRMRRRKTGDEPDPPDIGDPKTEEGRRERSRVAGLFLLAAKKHQAYLMAALQLVDAPDQRKSTDPGAIGTQLLSSLQPDDTHLRRVHGRVGDAPPEIWRRDDPFDPVLSAPAFPQPMYESLQQISQALVLPGLESVPPDTIAIIEPNHRFIEAFMVGLNHEMSRELLWRGHPGDPGATYFRHFWDRSGSTRLPAGSGACPDGEDIPAIREWSATAALGENVCGASAASGLLLLLRTALLQRYPSATIYAAKAVRRDGARVPANPSEHPEVYPLFRGTLSPDVTFFGFPLTEEEARGTKVGDDLGYFFVIQQHPTAPVFGLAAAPSAGGVSKWSALAWDDLVKTERDKTRTHVSVTEQSPTPTALDNVTWGQNAAHMAVITARPPVRVARHASLVLPPP